jgi:acylphosphatase
MREVHCIVSGDVQMVMYRAFAKKNADRLGIAGTVRNISDGTVEVVAQGDESRLKEFVEILRKGSGMSKVDDVKVEIKSPKERFSDFTVLH